MLGFQRRGATALTAPMALMALTALMLISNGARADDRPFAFAYTTDIEAQGEREIEQEITWSSGHAREAFQEIESRSEFEYGITDDFQGSFYLDYDWSRTHAPLGPAESSSLPGVSGEFIYRLTNVYFDPVGFALYAEPSIGNGTRSFELKALLQKNFLNDRLRFALNINTEDRWEKNNLGHYDQSSALEFYSGLAYNVTPDWSVGAELDNEREFGGLILGGSPRYASNATYFGPAITYEGHPFRVVLGAQAQMPWAGASTHMPGAISNGYLGDAEHFRVRLRMATDF
ncbi:MAG: transporter [Alphaproteobacteria bacterium]|nr:transporter [Alphaproteobacteria bacterium]